MAEENKKQKLKEKTENKPEETKAEPKIEEKKEAPKEERKKAEEKKEESKKAEVKKIKKDYANVSGRDLPISPKDSIHICNMIRGRTIDTALRMLEEVTQFKRVIKMNNREVPHKHGRGVMAGRYPIKAVKEFIRLIKQLKANAMHNELELEKCTISLCKADRASKPFRRGGARFKRAHVILRLEKKKETNAKQNMEKEK